MNMDIKDIMEQMQETPSPRCWESIASQLPAAGAAAGGSAAATAAKGAMSAGKLAAIIGSAQKDSCSTRGRGSCLRNTGRSFALQQWI